jgi:hypothetical protein
VRERPRLSSPARDKTTHDIVGRGVSQLRTIVGVAVAAFALVVLTEPAGAAKPIDQIGCELLAKSFQPGGSSNLGRSLAAIKVLEKARKPAIVAVVTRSDACDATIGEILHGCHRNFPKDQTIKTGWRYAGRP